jgi:hypothetical protein
VHVFAWEDFVARFGWNDRRRRLLTGLKSALDALKAAGCPWAYIDGSFVTAKEEPGDFDACWDMTGVDPYRLDPVLLAFDPGRLSQKIKYGGKLFPAQVIADGISGKTYMQFFRQTRRPVRRKGSSPST